MKAKTYILHSPEFRIAPMFTMAYSKEEAAKRFLKALAEDDEQKDIKLFTIKILLPYIKRG